LTANFAQGIEAVCGVMLRLTPLSDAMACPQGRQAALSRVGAA